MTRIALTIPGPSRSAISIGLLGAVGAVTALLAGLTLAPEPAISSPSAPAAVSHPVAAPRAAGPKAMPSGEPRRAVRVVYPGPVVAR
ncbi:hypothetical protein [Methylobacterium sp. WSM2598]|uniref:hypothetical protein n=1 Tax=Methylobacterium sp. WSM2598 TaxID=398261 RepID=UPI000373DD69|nr:hypothetical protein [Methylobacterium sp. WSM2598]